MTSEPQHYDDVLPNPGFEIAIAKDATAGAVLPKGDAYEAALLNFPHDPQFGADHR